MVPLVEQQRSRAKEMLLSSEMLLNALLKGSDQVANFLELDKPLVEKEIEHVVNLLIIDRLLEKISDS